MSTYPTPSDYQEAVQFPETAFVDASLQSATPRMNVLGLPQPITGAFAAVFPMTTETGADVAVKCFLSDVPDQRERYEAVSAHLDAVDLDATVEFDYQTRGIRVDGATYPVLVMEWAEGVALNRFVERHLDDPETLTRLADAWAALMASLEAAQVAHGDLQHGNVLVQPPAPNGDAPRLRLVDYDTTWVPALDGRSSAEVGHRNYQHPDRTDADFGPHIDRFAGLAVYVALHACAERPDLWDRHDTGENVLFRDADFYDPEASTLFEAITNVEALVGPVEALRRACYVEPEDVPPLAAVRSGEAASTVTTVEAGRARRRRERPDRTQRDAFAQLFLPGLLSGLVLCAAVGVAAGPVVGLGGGIALALGAAGLARRHYRRRPIVRRRRRLHSEDARFTKLIRSLERQIDSLRQQRQDVLDTVDERREERLQEVQDEALRDRLKHHFVGEAREVDGVTHKHVVRLKAANIRTAYEATPERIAAIRQVGDQTRARLNMWRASLVQRYADDVPDALSPAEERRLQRYVQRRLDDIDAQIARAREKIDVQTVERDRVRQRDRDMPDLPVGRYVRYLLRLDTLPSMTERPPVPTSTGNGTVGRDAPDDASVRIPDATDDADAPWWAAQ